MFVTSAVALTMLLALVVAGSASGAFPGRNGSIVFASTTGENVTPQLFSIGATGTGRKNLTLNHYSNLGGVWSPDGRQIVFCQPDAPGFALVVMNANGSAQRRLTHAERCTDGLSWSPDGRLIAYRASVATDGIHVIRPDGSEERVVARDLAGVGAPVWSPDGRRLAVATAADAGGEALTVLDVDGATRQDLLRGAHYANPAWSPDGRVLAYARYTDGSDWEIRTIRLDGTGDHRIADGSRALWSPDGRRLAVIRRTEGSVLSLTVIAADGSGVILLTRNTDGNASWSPDGRGVAFVENFRDVFFVRADGSGRRRVTHEPIGSRVEEAQWSPDGKRILYQATHALNDEELYVVASDGGVVRRLTRNGIGDFDPAWSPDGSEIAFVRQRRDDSRIIVTDDAGRDARVLMVGGANSSPSWSPDGSELVFARGSPDDESSRLYAVGREGSRLTSLGSGSDPAWSPDGKRIAFINGGAMWLMRRDGSHRRLFLRPRAAATALEVEADAIESFSAPAWSPDGKSLAFAAYYYPYGPRGDYLAALTARIDRSHIEAHLWDIEPGGLTADWSPDGKSLLFGAGQVLVQPVNSTRHVALTHLPGWSGDANWQPRCTTHGSARPDVLLGSEGDEVICGLDGDDSITGGRGSDRLYGESGNDRIGARDRGFDVIGCGAGNDTVIADPIDLVGRDCEHVMR